MFWLAAGNSGEIMAHRLNHLKLLLPSALLLLSSTALWAESSVSHIFLVQNSGWMLPFYEDPDSKFKNLVVELSNRLSKYGKPEQIVVSFNQSIGENKSPLLVYRGSDKTQLQSAVQSIQLARKPGRQSYADTDFKEAIIGAITQFSPGESCLLWIVTNNKNSPDNSPETVEKNTEFYNFLQNAREIKRIVAFPHERVVRGLSKKEYVANGLMIYALAYGEQAEQVLQKMLAVNAPFGKQPARLKPLDAEALTFIPRGVKGKDVDARLAPDGNTIELTFSADRKPEVAELSGQLRNDFFPYDIRSASIEIDSEGFQSEASAADTKILVSLSSQEIFNIPAGELSPEIKLRIQVPAIPSPWNPEILFGNGYATHGEILFRLKNQKLAINDGFAHSMTTLFPHDPLPEIFVPGESAKNSLTHQAFIIRVEYPVWPLLILVALSVTLTGIFLGGIVLMRREMRYQVSVDGVQKTYGLRPFSEVVIRDQQGAKIGVLKRGLVRTKISMDRGKNNSVRVS
jgi:hypothetical protein